MNDQSISDSPELAVLKRRIAELEASEARIQAEYEHLKQLYERAPLAYQSLDSAGCFIAINQAWADTLGYAKEEVLGRNFGDFLHPDWKDHFKENFPRFKAIGEILGIEFEMVRKDGSTILVSFHGKIGKDSLGHFQQTHCIFHDITKQKQEEKELHRSNSFNQSIIDSSPDCIKILDLNGRLQYMSPQGQVELMINNIDAFLNTAFKDFWKGADCESALTAIKKAKEGRQGCIRSLWSISNRLLSENLLVLLCI